MTTPIEQSLETIRKDATAALTRERRAHALRPALDGALAAAALVAVGYVVTVGIAHWAGGDLEVPAGWTVAALVLVPAVAVFLTAFPARRAVSTEEALTLADERHDLKDRLRTAHEFLSIGDRTPFMDAALVDATDHAERASIRGIPRGQGRAAISTRSRALLPLLLAALIGGLYLPSSVREDRGEDVVERQPDVEQLADEAPPKQPEQSSPVVPTPGADVVRESRKPGRAPRASGAGRKDMQLDTDVKKTRGAMGSGQSADAASASGNSEARGAPSSQAQASKAGKKPKKKKKKKPKKRPRKDPEEVEQKAKKPENDSGATAGRGAASGSNKSPSASPWSSKDQVTSEDEEDLEDDEEVDDEFDNSDARGGVQPHLRDRRPPVNRDLGIGFGNGKNPDANGRGGPSELKKSRGVAALVLGVPIPDHIKGRPNAGKTKITQERVEPQVEDPTAAQATARAPRHAPIGHVADPTLDAWMRNLIRDYFKAIRPRPQNPTNNPAKKSGD